MDTFFNAMREEVGSRVVYISKDTIDEDGPEEYVGKVYMFEVAYLYQGVFHVFGLEAPWLQKYEEASEAGTVYLEVMENLRIDVLKRKDEILNDFLEYQKKHKLSINPESKPLHRDFINFMLVSYEKYGLPKVSSDEFDEIDSPEKDLFYGIVHDIYYDDLRDACREREVEIVDEVMPKIVEWTSKLTLRDFKKRELDSWLEEQGSVLSPKSRNKIWDTITKSMRSRGY